MASDLKYDKLGLVKMWLVTAVTAAVIRRRPDLRAIPQRWWPSLLQKEEYVTAHQHVIFSKAFDLCELVRDSVRFECALDYINGEFGQQFVAASIPTGAVVDIEFRGFMQPVNLTHCGQVVVTLCSAAYATIPDP